jgi:hypothetical protein
MNTDRTHFSEIDKISFYLRSRIESCFYLLVLNVITDLAVGEVLLLKTPSKNARIAFVLLDFRSCEYENRFPV